MCTCSRPRGLADEQPRVRKVLRMLIRATRMECLVMLRNGLTLELNFDRSGHTRGVWLLGDRWLFEVVAAEA